MNDEPDWIPPAPPNPFERYRAEQKAKEDYDRTIRELEEQRRETERRRIAQEAEYRDRQRRLQQQWDDDRKWDVENIGPFYERLFLKYPIGSPIHHAGIEMTVTRHIPWSPWTLQNGNPFRGQRAVIGAEYVLPDGSFKLYEFKDSHLAGLADEPLPVRP